MGIFFWDTLHSGHRFILLEFTQNHRKVSLTFGTHSFIATLLHIGSYIGLSKYNLASTNVKRENDLTYNFNNG